MKIIRTIVLSALIAAPTLLTPINTFAGEREDAIVSILNSYKPGTMGVGPFAVENLSINDKKKTIDVTVNTNATYLTFTPQQLEQMKDQIRTAMGSQYAKYKVNITGDGKNFDKLALFSNKKFIAPKEKDAFVIKHDAQPAPEGLDGSNIALWQSHGWYFEPKLNRWEWQRARIFQTVEDLYTQSYVMPFLMPMLENAGAYVMSPRERDINTTELIIDNDASQFVTGKMVQNGAWKKADANGFGYTTQYLHNGEHPFQMGSAIEANLSGSAKTTASVSYDAAIPEKGTYAVYVSYATVPNSTKAAEYTVNAADGAHRFTINQRMGGGTWIYLGHFPFDASKDAKTLVELSNAGKNRKEVVTADAVKIGGGMGNVARIVKEPLDDIEYEYVVSNYPRFVEGARYFLQWAGAPDSVFTPSDYVNDYGDDYRSRGLWVNWLAGGSSVLPKQEGLNIPIDLSFAFHSDAGTTRNDSIIGTLGIYSTYDGTYANGTDRMVSRDYNDLVMTNIVNDIRETFEPNWTRRGMWDQRYFEARVPEVPAMLLELLSHQNFADMKYGLDPAFRFVVSRAIYKGMLQFLAQRDGRSYVVQPLPVHAFAITENGTNSYRLAWDMTVDKLEPTANPTYYIIEERINDGAFRPVAKVSAPEYVATVTDSDIHSYRIIAGNDGGVSFPSEVLALCNKPGKPAVTIVNGFTRISAPDWFDSGEIAGFYDIRDHGVPYVQDISFIGDQFEFRREIPWMDDDAAGFGASRANYEEKVIAGNTFDFVYSHGEAISKCGYGFVSSSVEAFTNATDKPAMVDIIMGKQKEIQKGRGVFGTYFKTFPSELQNRIASLTGTGTSFFITGSYIATDLWDNPNSSEEVAAADKEFARNILGYNWRVGQASVTGEAYQVQTRFKAFTKGDYTFSNTLNADLYAVESPDSFYPVDNAKGATFMRYTENNLIAGTAYDAGNYRTVCIGFPFESIFDADARAHLMKQVLDFFNK